MSTGMSTVLCGTDFTPRAERAVDAALRLARATGARLIVAHLVHVSSGEVYSHESGGPRSLTLPEARTRAQHQLEELRARRLSGYDKVELLVEFGAPADALIALAADRAVDVLVVAAPGHSELGELLRGSVTEALTRRAPCPVLVVPPAASPAAGS